MSTLRYALAWSMAVCVCAAWEEHKVPGDFGTLRDALSTAKAGDTIAVAPGTYPELVRIPDGVTQAGSGQDGCAIKGDGLHSSLQGTPDAGGCPANSCRQFRSHLNSVI